MDISIQTFPENADGPLVQIYNGRTGESFDLSPAEALMLMAQLRQMLTDGVIKVWINETTKDD